MPNSEITLRNIFRAQQLIRPIARKTPLIKSPVLTERAGASVYLKLETLQETGAFKIRGAANKLLNLGESERERGVVAVSTGNHGRAVAYVANQLGIRAAICLSERVPENKVEALRRLQAEVIIHGQSQDEALERALGLMEEQGLIMVDPFDDPLVIAGQGTIGLELLEELPEIDTVLVPLSGGGLISGIALALKTASPAIRVVGISMERAPVMYHSLQAGSPVQMPEEETLADSLQGGIGLDNQYTYRLVQEYVDDIILLSEEEIAGGMVFALTEHHIILEGGGAVGLAALLHQKIPKIGRNVAVIASGGNIDLGMLLKIVQSRI